MPVTELQIPNEIIQLIDHGISPAIFIVDFTNNLATYLNDLIQNNFQKLLSVLYKIDIDENELRRLLQATKDANAGELIAQLIIKRHLNKIESRKKYQENKDNIAFEDKW